MPQPQPTMAGQPIQVPAGLTGRCQACQFREEDGGGRLVTDGTEIADVTDEMIFNGQFWQTTGGAAVMLPCPVCGASVQFPIRGMSI
jgi:hypothetical protein